MSSTNKTTAKALGDLLPELALPDNVAQLSLAGLSQDSRNIAEGFLFIALQGQASDGRQYIDQAIAAGARCVLRQAQHQAINYRAEVPVIDLVDLPRKVSAIAAEFYSWPAKKLRVLAVTGTNGKTSCVVLLCDLLQRLGKKAGLIGTLGYGFYGEPLRETGLTTPDPIACQRILAELLAAGAEFVAMEASSHAIAQYRLEAIDFEGLVFTNLSRDHLDYHPDLASYQAAKLRLFKFPGVKFIVTNIDCETGRKVQGIAGESNIRCVTYALSRAADLVAEDTHFTAQGIEAMLLSPWGREKLRSALVAPFNLNNLLAVISCAVEFGFSMSRVLAEVANLRPVRGRLEKIAVTQRQTIHVFIDYAHTPDALQRALEGVGANGQQALWVVFGCGGDRDKGKRPMMGAIASRLAEKIVLTSDNPRSENPETIVADIFQGVTESQRHKVIRIVEREAAISHAIAAANDHDIVLVAGKGHEDYQIIDGEKRFFDDAEAVKRCLQQRYAAAGGA